MQEKVRSIIIMGDDGEDRIVAEYHALLFIQGKL